jgi:hypothetical protein
MTDHKFDKSTDRHATLLDFKQRLIDLMANSQQLPETEWDEEPVRYYKLNKKWAPIVFGWLDWLEDVAGWADAEDENYEGIQAILAFEEGIDLPEFELDCGDVEDCLETSTIINNIIDSIDGIEQGGSQSGNPNNVDKPPAQGAGYETGNEAAFDPVDCGHDDLDKLWGAISDFVDFAHNVNLDFFQQISSYTSRAKLLGTIISAIPLFGLLPIDEAVSAAAQLADFISVDYNASVTTVGLYEIKCDLFCDAVANGCHFDVNTAFAYFLDNDGISGINADSTFEDYVANIASGFTVTGNEVFNLMSAWQLAVASLGEKFGNATGMNAYTKAAQAGALSPDSGWEAWCEECQPEDGDWVVVLDFANDYVKEDEDEIVYRNAFNLLHESTAFSTTGASTISNQYASGLIYNSSGGSNKFKNQELRVSNAGAFFKQLQINAQLDAGTASQFSIDTDSNTYNPPPRQFSSGEYSWSSAVGVANVAGTPGSITRIALNFTQVSSTQTCQGLMRYIRITGTGERPQFI